MNPPDPNDPRVRRNHRAEWEHIDEPSLPVWLLRWLWSWPRQAWGWASYAVRPYDMIADRRRWVWQPRTRCGFSYGYTLDNDGRLEIRNPDGDS